MSGDERPVLPARVRRALVDLAAGVLGELTDDEVPVTLRRVRAFAPARRARAGASALALALETDERFRRRVAAAWRADHPELAARAGDPRPGDPPPGEAAAGDPTAGNAAAGESAAGEPVPALDPVVEATGLYLIRPEGWVARLPEIEAPRPAAEEPGREPVALARAQARAVAAEEARDGLAGELATLRRELRKHRSDADRARAAAREAERELAQEQDRSGTAIAERDELVRRAERQAQEAVEALSAARRSGRESRSLAEIRIRLLLDTIVDSAAALRRELALPPAGEMPADVVASRLSASTPAPAIGSRGRSGDDPALLAEVLRLPRAHLIVDGYNVSKEGFAALPLIDQRRLLVDALAALAGRIPAEITCCFDGADVQVRAQGLVRGVRVLFSDPGTTADELIATLVRAEPPGRVLAVVSTDGEVAGAALGAGAASFASSVLLRLLGSGPRDRPAGDGPRPRRP